MYPMENRCTSVETPLTTRSITAVTLATRIPTLRVNRSPTESHGVTTWYWKFGSYDEKTSRKMPTDIARPARIVARQSQSPLRGSRLPTAMLMKNDASGRSGMM